MITKELRKSARDSYEYFVENAKKSLLEGKSLEPVVHAAIIKDGQFSLLPIPLSDSTDASQRRAVTGMVASLIAKEGYEVIMFFLVFEAWGSKPPKGKDALSVMPSQDPNRFEIFATSAIEDTGDQSNMFLKIVREGKTCRLEPQEGPEGAFSTTKFLTEEEREKQEIKIGLECTILGVAWKAYRDGLKLVKKIKKEFSKNDLTSKEVGV